MASGFEAVGLVLAIFPILVEGRKLYKENKSRVRDFIGYRHVLKQIVRGLSREQTRFHNSSYRFLEGVSMYHGLSAHDIAQMIDDIRWRNQVVVAEDP